MQTFQRVTACPGGVVQLSLYSIPSGSCSVCGIFIPELRFACTGLMILKPHSGFKSSDVNYYLDRTYFI